MNVKLKIPDILGETIQKSHRTQGIKAEEMHRLLDAPLFRYRKWTQQAGVQCLNCYCAASEY